MTVKPYRRAVAALVLAAAGLLVLAGAASARTVNVYAHQPTVIDGAETTAGTLACVSALGVNQTSGRIYVLDPCRYESAITQFAPDGTPQVFPALINEETSVSLHSEGGIDLVVDNSGTSSEGNFYALNGRNTLKGFKADGTELSGNFPLSSFVEACGIAIDPQGNIWVSNYFTSRVTQYTSLGVPTGKAFDTPFPCHLAIDAQGDFYVQERFANVRKYDSEGHFLFYVNATPSESIAVDRSTGNLYVVETPSNATYVQEYSPQGTPLAVIGVAEGGFPGFEGANALAIRESTKEIYVNNGHSYSGAQHVEVFKQSGTAVVPTVTTDTPDIGTAQATLHGTIDLDGGGNATECVFEWGRINVGHPFLGTVDHVGPFEHSLPCDQATPISGSGAHQLTATLSGLEQGTLYHYRLVSRNSNGRQSTGVDWAFRPQGPLSLDGERATEVNTDGATIEADIDPNGGTTTYTVEYGPEDCASSSCETASIGTLPNSLGVQKVAVVLTGLDANTTYHYRVFASNELSSATGSDLVLHTFAEESGADPCANAFVRKQTKAAQLPDCRAYELVSAPNAGGYDVRSDIIEGQTPFTAVPQAKDRVLYTLNFGKVPGVNGEPTNLGSDPYVASRTSNGWQTRYVGIDVGFPPEQGPFASPSLEESSDLSSLAFGGPQLCHPCFADGKTGVPVHRSDGSLVQGMAGSLDPGPAAAPDGYVGRRLSADGTHLVFGSASQFEPDGNSNGDVSIYDRNLSAGVTHVVSKAPNGSNLVCLQGAGACHSPGDGSGIGELGMSDDGSRIVVGQRVSTDAAGNNYWHPYMNIGDAAQTVDLAPGATSGVIYDGMTSSGSAVLFTTADRLTADDHDNSPDIYRASVSGAGAVTLTRVSTGSGSGDTDACDPVAAAGRNNWNAIGAASTNNCGAVAFAGGAGVASENGTIYFLSPEKLDGSNGVSNYPNLYVAAPGGSPRFIATLEPGNQAVAHAVTASGTHSYGDFQVTPDGSFAVFASAESLTGYPSFGHLAIYRYDLAGDQLQCASCGATGAYLKSDTSLSRYGSNLADDGRVFFTSDEPLALRDSGSTADVYEWTQGDPQLISTGRSAADSSLVTVSSDGVNAFFFTRDDLVPEDHNGNAVRIYDAREGGGFEQVPQSVPCQASDECHGPGTVAPIAASIPTFSGTGGNFVQKKAKPRHRKHHKHRHKKRHAKNHHGRAR
jgi:hypothetical protein